MSCTTAPDQVWPTLPIFADTLSPPDQVPWGQWRASLNMQCKDGKLGPRTGWKRWGHWTTEPNSDLHDQLINLTWSYLPRVAGEDGAVITWPNDACTGPLIPGSGLVEPITTIWNQVLASRRSALLVATQSRIYEWQQDGRWRVLGHHLGGPTNNVGIRWQFAALGHLIFGTNNATEPVYYSVGSAPSGCDAQMVHPIPDLRTIGVTRAGTVATWRGTVFLGNVFMDGVQATNRILWCNANAGLEWLPSDASTAGFQDLDPGETILRYAVVGDSLYAFTDRSIWRGTVVESGFFFTQVYTHVKGASCLLYPYSLAVHNEGTAIYIGTGNRLFTFSPYSPAPVEIDWMKKASGRLKRINPRFCNTVTGLYRDDLREYIVSYPTGDTGIPNECLTIDLDDSSSSSLNHGFWSFEAIRLRSTETFAEHLVSSGICTAEGVDDMWPPIKEEPRETGVFLRRSGGATPMADDGTFDVVADFYSGQSDPPDSFNCINERLDLMLHDLDVPAGYHVVEVGPRHWSQQGFGGSGGSYPRIEKLVQYNCVYADWWAGAQNASTGGQGFNAQWWITSGDVHQFSVRVRYELDEEPPDPTDPGEGGEGGGGGGGGGGTGSDGGGGSGTVDGETIPGIVGWDTKKWCKGLPDPFSPCLDCPKEVWIGGASASDNCLKHLNEPFYAREMRRSDGSYFFSLYQCSLSTGAMTFGQPDKRKTMSALALTWDADATSSPWDVQCGIGQSSFPSDPVAEKCPIRRWPLSKKPMNCPASSEEVQYARWTFVTDARFLYFMFNFVPTVASTAGWTLTSLTAMVAKSANASG